MDCAGFRVEPLAATSWLEKAAGRAVLLLKTGRDRVPFTADLGKIPVGFLKDSLNQPLHSKQDL